MVAPATGSVCDLLIPSVMSPSSFELWAVGERVLLLTVSFSSC